MKNYTFVILILIGLIVLSHIIDSPLLFVLAIILGIISFLYLHLKNRFNEKNITKLKLFVKFITAIISLIIFYFFTLQIGILNIGSRQAGIIFLMFIFCIVLPYIVLIFTIDSSKSGLINLKLAWSLVIIFLAFMIIGILNPLVGAMFSFTIPLIGYVIIYTKYLNKFRLVAISVLFVYLLLTPYYFIKGTDLGNKLRDPCFRREPYGKGEPFYIKNGRVCAYFKNGLNGNFATVKGADSGTYKYLSNSCGYTEDKNRVYYNHQPISADVATFHCKSINPSIKHALCKDIICSDKDGVWEKGVRRKNDE